MCMSGLMRSPSARCHEPRPTTDDRRIATMRSPSASCHDPTASTDAHSHDRRPPARPHRHATPAATDAIASSGSSAKRTLRERPSLFVPLVHRVFDCRFQRFCLDRIRASSSTSRATIASAPLRPATDYNFLAVGQSPHLPPRRCRGDTGGALLCERLRQRDRPIFTLALAILCHRPSAVGH